MIDMEYILNSSLCKHCECRATRVVSMEGLEFVEVDNPEEYPITQKIDMESNSITHNFCTIFCLDLDHIVLDCSRFVKVKE